MKARGWKRRIMTTFLTAVMVMNTFSPAVYGAEFTDGEDVFAEFAEEMPMENVPKGRYFAALHAWNRTSKDGKKVFSPWSDSSRIIVK